MLEAGSDLWRASQAARDASLRWLVKGRDARNTQEA